MTDSFQHLVVYCFYRHSDYFHGMIYLFQSDILSKKINGYCYKIFKRRNLFFLGPTDPTNLLPAVVVLSVVVVVVDVDVVVVVVVEVVVVVDVG